MNLIDTVIGLNKIANEALNSTGVEDPRVGQLNPYRKDGKLIIPVSHEHSEYELVNGVWQETPVF